MHDVCDTNYKWRIVESLLQFSEPKRYKFHAKVETSCQTVQNVEWSDALVDTNDVLQCVYSITYKANEWYGG